MSASRIDNIQTAGVNDVFEYNEIHLDSHKADNRSSGTAHTNPSFALQPALPNVMGIKLLNAQIPFTWHIVTDQVGSQNNLFNLNGTPYIIPVGSYSAVDFLSTLNGLTDVTDQSTAPDQSSTLPGPLLAYWNVDSPTQRLTVVLPDSPATTPVVLTFPQLGSAARLFGVDPDKSPGTFSQTLTHTPYLFDYPLNIAGPNYLLLTSRAIAPRVNKNVRINGSSTPSPTILAKIPVPVNFGDVILYEDHNPGYAFDMGLENLQNVDLTLLDGDTLLPITIDNSWSVTLMALTQRETSVPRNRAVETPTGTAKRLRVN